MDVNNLFKNLSVGGGLGSAVGGLAGLFGNKGSKNNPGAAANQYLNQIPGAINPYFQPYINAGQQTSPQLQQLYSQLSSSPGNFYNWLGTGYHESPGYQFKLQQGLGAAGNAAAAGGFLGTPMHQQNATQIAEGYANQDFNDYLNQVLGLFQGGIAGQEGIANKGYGASQRYGENLGNVLGQQAQYGYAGKAGENQGKTQNWANIVGGLSQAAPWLFGG
jgi:hypothetical protein